MARMRRFEKPKSAEERVEETLAALESWHPKTSLGKRVKAGEITDIDQILSSGQKILEVEVVDSLMPGLEIDFINIGQVPGKFGGGRRRIFRQTQKKTKEGNKPIFTVMAVVGNRNGYVGVGLGRSKETKPARDKAIRAAKLNIIQVARGCGSWECGCGTFHSVPFKLIGKESSVTVKILPAPKGTRLAIEAELKKILTLAGYKDVWSQATGQSRNKINLVRACMKSLKQATSMRVSATNPTIKKGALEHGR